MKKVIQVSIILTLVIFTACQKSIPKDQKLMNEIDQLISQNAFDQALEKCNIILNKFPESKYAMKANLEIGKFYHSKAISGMDENKQLQEAVNHYLKVYNHYPDSSISEQALFHAGFILANELQMYDSAKVIYNRFIEAYPESQLAQPVKYELQNLGITPDQILEMNRKN